MSEINDYCPIVNETVNVFYHTQKVPVLGKVALPTTDSVDSQVLNAQYS